MEQNTWGLEMRFQACLLQQIFLKRSIFNMTWHARGKKKIMQRKRCPSDAFTHTTNSAQPCTWTPIPEYSIDLSVEYSRRQNDQNACFTPSGRWRAPCRMPLTQEEDGLPGSQRLRDPPEIDVPSTPPTIPSTEQEGEREQGCYTQRRKSTA